MLLANNPTTSAQVCSMPLDNHLGCRACVACLSTSNVNLHNKDTETPIFKRLEISKKD